MAESNLQSTSQSQNDECASTERLIDAGISPEIIAPEDMQQFYYESLGDRDWDAYKDDEQIFLKRNIGYAIFGPPGEDNLFQNGNISMKETGYSKRQNSQIDDIYEAILNNHFIEDRCVVLIRTIFICCESKDKKKTMFIEPIFVVKKCQNKNKYAEISNCKIFIDSHARVYQTWDLYLENNRLPKCTMIYPKDGHYTGEIINQDLVSESDCCASSIDTDKIEIKVLIERRDSPACALGNVILNGTDTAGTVVSVGTTLTFVAAAIPGIAVAPALLTASAIGGVGVGIYSIGRSIQTLVDRKKHDQSIGLDNSESRWCWLNTTVGVLGASASAATGLLTQAAARGVEIGRAARIAFNGLHTANMIGSATNLALSGYNIIDKLINKEKPSALEVFQFASSMLFFHNSVANFKTANTIISETQSITLENYANTLRSNRHRKIFRKAQLEARRLKGDAAGNAEIISGIQNINDPDNFFAGLVQMNKDLNQNNARFTITRDGKVEINSNYIVDPIEFSTVGQTDRLNILQSLPAYQQTNTSVITINQSTFENKFGFISTYCESLLSNPYLIKEIIRKIINNEFDLKTITALINNFPNDVIRLLLDMLISFLKEIQDSLEDFKKLNPLVSLAVGGLQYLIYYVQNLADSMHLNLSDFLMTCFNYNGTINERFLLELVANFREWLRNKIESFKQAMGDPMSAIKSKTKQLKDCTNCSGHYYECVLSKM